MSAPLLSTFGSLSGVQSNAPAGTRKPTHKAGSSWCVGGVAAVGGVGIVALPAIDLVVAVPASDGVEDFGVYRFPTVARVFIGTVAAVGAVGAVAPVFIGAVAPVFIGTVAAVSAIGTVAAVGAISDVPCSSADRHEVLAASTAMAGVPCERHVVFFAPGSVVSIVFTASFQILVPVVHVVVVDAVASFLTWDLCGTVAAIGALSESQSKGD